MDYRKVFYHANHAIILHKLNDMGAPEFVTRWLYSFLTDRQQRVKIDDTYSRMTPLKQQFPLIPFSIKTGDNALQQIAEMTIASIVLSPFFIENGIS